MPIAVDTFPSGHPPYQPSLCHQAVQYCPRSLCLSAEFPFLGPLSLLMSSFFLRHTQWQCEARSKGRSSV